MLVIEVVYPPTQTRSCRTHVWLHALMRVARAWAYLRKAACVLSARAFFLRFHGCIANYAQLTMDGFLLSESQVWSTRFLLNTQLSAEEVSVHFLSS